MDFLQVGNWLFDALAADLTDAATSMTVDDADNICPVDDLGARVYPFEVTLFDSALGSPELDPDGREIVLVTASSGNTLTITRAQGGTTAVAHSAGEFCGVYVNASHLQELQEAVAAAGTGDGDVTGPESAVEGNFAAFADTSGKVIEDSGYAPADFAADDHDHSGTYEPVLTKGDLTAGSTKITIGGTGTGAVIGAGVSVDVAQGNLDHGSIGGLADDDHSQYHNDTRADTWHGALSGAHVTGGDSHDHNGDDGAQIAYSSLSGLPTLKTADVRHIVLLPEGSYLPSSNPATLAANSAGSNAELPKTISFPHGANYVVWWREHIPYNYTGGAITIRTYWLIGASAGNISLSINAVCAGDNDPLDASPAATGVGGITSIGDGYAAGDVQALSGSWSSNLPTAGDVLLLRVRRLNHSTGDYLNATATLLKVVLDVPVSLA